MATSKKVCDDLLAKCDAQKKEIDRHKALIVRLRRQASLAASTESTPAVAAVTASLTPEAPVSSKAIADDLVCVCVCVCVCVSVCVCVCVL